MVVVKRTPGKRVRGFACTPGRDVRRSDDRRLEILQPACRPRRDSRDAQRAFTLTEVLVAVVIVSIVFVTLFTAFSSGFAILKLARENLRATQILVQRMETLRLYTWGQIQNPTYFPTNFTAYYDPAGQTTNSGDIVYTGTITRTSGPAFSPAADYSTNMLLVQLRVSWPSGKVQRQREVSTYVARYGLQNYLYTK